MSNLDLARVLIGVFCAVLAPWSMGLRLLSSPWIRGAAGGSIATYACQPAIDSPAAWVAIAAAVGLAGWLDPVVACGFLLATVVAGEVIAICLKPLLQPIRRVSESAPELANAGRIIGWVERAIIYAAVLVSHPEAAALIVAVKSLARLDELKEGAFVEYFLIGTLLSLLAALGTGIAVDRLL